MSFTGMVPMINERCLFFFTQAYHFSPIKKIVGVEINSELCDLQQKITEKYRMHDRVEVSLLNLKKKYFKVKIVSIHMLASAKAMRFTTQLHYQLHSVLL